MPFSWSAVLSPAVLFGTACADLRAASQPRRLYAVATRPLSERFVTPWEYYYEPSSFNYNRLANQKRRNYDNFLRSNIDNQQDQRNFNDEDGEDHLPFRTLRTGRAAADMHEVSYMPTFPGSYPDSMSRRRRGGVAPPTIDPKEYLNYTVGVPHVVPLRWNNPHASELEVNIWVTNYKVVVPIRKPACSGEGHQDNAFSFIIPNDFLTLGSKVPNFNGCNAIGDCVLQVYSHSVESRTFAFGKPIIVPGSNAPVANPATDDSQIQPMTVDPGMDLSALKRDTCLSSGDTSVHITSAVPRHARLVSDVYNHAYQNSDYSPYSGQQHEEISRNMQASCILQMVPGNRGELGKSLLSSAESSRLARARRRVKNLVRKYESITNKLIDDFGDSQMSNTGVVPQGQQLSNCFRCVEVGATNPARLETTTYIPSFQIPANLQQRARDLVPSAYQNLISSTGVCQIYMAALEVMNTTFTGLMSSGFSYMGPMVKSTTTTMADPTNFKKRTATGGTDQGQYAAGLAQAARQAAADRVSGLAAAPQGLVTLTDSSSEDVTYPDTGFTAVTIESDEQMNGLADDLPCENDENITADGVVVEDPSCQLVFAADALESGGSATTTGGGSGATTTGGGSGATTTAPSIVDGASGRSPAYAALAVTALAAVIGRS